MNRSIFSFTSNEFASLVQHKLGKGRQHALLLYREWFRTGQTTGSHPAFSNCPKLLAEICSLAEFSLPSLAGEQTDSTAGKFLIQTTDSLEIESVFIPMQAGGTLCISSQVGCRMGCAFCETGRMGLLRSLTIEEITAQLFAARFLKGYSIKNLVFMGMGEPFDNYDAVMKAVKIFTDQNGFGLGPQNITISTSGRAEEIFRMAEEDGPIPHLAVSINAPVNTLRNLLMPVNRSVPLEELHRSMHHFNAKRGKEVFIAYVLMKSQNDSLEHADQLADYLKGLMVKINLIPYNPQSRDRFLPPEQAVIDAFAARLRFWGYYTLIRQTKGQEIMAACGQLGNLKLRRQIRDGANSTHIDSFGTAQEDTRDPTVNG